MADKQQAGAAGADPNANVPVNMAEYKKSQARVRELVEKRRLLERRLVRVDFFFFFKSFYLRLQALTWAWMV